jgi:hypothetical protein
MAAGSSESEVLARELDSLGQKIHALEARLAEVREDHRRPGGSRSDHGPRLGGGVLALGFGVQSDAQSRVRGATALALQLS